MSVYTRTGDTGTTSLFGGKRVRKSEQLVEAYGSVDELNSWIGLIISETDEEHLTRLLREIQSDLFVIGAKLAGGKTNLTVLDTRVTQMEVEIDAMDQALPELNNFILPGGSSHAAHIHIARNVCRRAERRIVALPETFHISPSIIKYLNRFSDLLFVLARFINSKSKTGDILWSGDRIS
jgi:cob(I)alamin adenosyltransferase